MTTLTEVDVILGMDILSKMTIDIKAREGIARPRQPEQDWSHLVLRETIKVPAMKSRVFFLENHLPGLVLFEPGMELPEGLQRVPTLGKGSQLAVQLDNRSEEDILLSPQWTIGTAFPVQLVVKEPSTAEEHLPEIPGNLNNVQQRQLQK